jgi:uncharacterized membrane protein YphA (DoxX/SURF4 family)
VSDALATAAAIVLGAAMVIAGAGKIASRSWPEQATALGAPAWAVPTVPWLEMALGALLVADLGVRWVAVAVVLLLLTFTGLLAMHLASGDRPVCACFGPLSRRPISWWSVVRNLALVALGVVVIVAG